MNERLNESAGESDCEHETMKVVHRVGRRLTSRHQLEAAQSSRVKSRLDSNSDGLPSR
jgi:hypothetical protein